MKQTFPEFNAGACAQSHDVLPASPKSMVDLLSRMPLQGEEDS